MIGVTLAPVSVKDPDVPSVCSPTGAHPPPPPGQVQFCGPPIVRDVGVEMTVDGSTLALMYLMTWPTTMGSNMDCPGPDPRWACDDRKPPSGEKLTPSREPSTDICPVNEPPHATLETSIPVAATRAKRSRAGCGPLAPGGSVARVKKLLRPPWVELAHAVVARAAMLTVTNPDCGASL